VGIKAEVRIILKDCKGGRKTKEMVGGLEVQTPLLWKKQETLWWVSN